jgi:hypothetical protein
MNLTWSNSFLAWITRTIAILFIAVNAWGWWNESQARQDTSFTMQGSDEWVWQWAVVTHLLPLILILAATIMGWRLPIYGNIGFGLFAVVQALSVGVEWMYLPYVALPPLFIAGLYLAGWLGARRAIGNTIS